MFIINSVRTVLLNFQIFHSKMKFLPTHLKITLTHRGFSNIWKYITMLIQTLTDWSL